MREARKARNDVEREPDRHELDRELLQRRVGLLAQHPVRVSYAFLDELPVDGCAVGGGLGQLGEGNGLLWDQ